ELLEPPDLSRNRLAAVQSLAEPLHGLVDGLGADGESRVVADRAHYLAGGTVRDRAVHRAGLHRGVRSEELLKLAAGLHIRRARNIPHQLLELLPGAVDDLDVLRELGRPFRGHTATDGRALEDH